jgi:hypothetical protein
LKIRTRWGYSYAGALDVAVERHALASTLLGRPSLDRLACWTAESSKRVRVLAESPKASLLQADHQISPAAAFARGAAGAEVRRRPLRRSSRHEVAAQATAQMDDNEVRLVVRRSLPLPRTTSHVAAVRWTTIRFSFGRSKTQSSSRAGVTASATEQKRTQRAMSSSWRLDSRGRNRPGLLGLTSQFVAKRKFAPARENGRQVLARGRRFS